MNPPITVRRIDRAEAPSRADALAHALADVLMDCVQGGASVSFMSSLTLEQAVALWRHVLHGVAQGERVLLVAEAPGGRVVGTVQLILSMPDNQPHRADVAKMLVHRSARRRGVAQALMAAVETEATAERRSVLVLDTVTGGDAERLYARAGWQRVGSVPNYALFPDGRYCGSTYFYKQL